MSKLSNQLIDDFFKDFYYFTNPQKSELINDENKERAGLINETNNFFAQAASEMLSSIHSIVSERLLYEHGNEAHALRTAKVVEQYNIQNPIIAEFLCSENTNERLFAFKLKYAGNLSENSGNAWDQKAIEKFVDTLVNNVKYCNIDHLKAFLAVLNLDNEKAVSYFIESSKNNNDFSFKNVLIKFKDTIESMVKGNFDAIQDGEHKRICEKYSKLKAAKICEDNLLFAETLLEEQERVKIYNEEFDAFKKIEEQNQNYFELKQEHLKLLEKEIQLTVLSEENQRKSISSEAFDKFTFIKFIEDVNKAQVQNVATLIADTDTPHDDSY